MKILPALVMLGALIVSQARAEETTVLVAFGDSLTAGYGLVPEEAFPVQLESRLKKDGYNVSVINQGISGDTSAGGAARLDEVFRKNPYMVIIELGGNDLLRGLPIADTNMYLSVIMKRLSNAHIKMVLTGQVAPMTLGNKYATAYNNMFPELAKTYKAILYPNFLENAFGVPGMMQQDGIHPTKEGVAVIVSGITPLIERQLNVDHPPKR